MRRQHGFTLIELIITITIVAIVMGFALPSFQALIKNTRIKTEAGELERALAFARSEAAKLNRWVTLCARETDTKCSATGWDKGWLLFVDATSATDMEGNGVVDAALNDKVLRVRNGLPTKVVLSTAGLPASQHFIRLMPNGNIADLTPPAKLKICDDRTGNFGRAIELRAIGRTHHNQGACP